MSVRPPRRLGAAVARVVRPVWDAVFGEPIREGRLRLQGARPVEQQLARIGLVVLGLMLVSVLFAGAWRRGNLVFLTDAEGRSIFLPEPLLPVTLLALAVGWFVFLWGGSLGSLPVRLGSAAAFAVVNGPIGRPLSVDIGGHPGLHWGPTLGRTGYFAAIGFMLLLSIGPERWRRRLRPVGFVGMALSLLALFGAQLWVHVGTAQLGLLNAVPGFLHGSIEAVGRLLLPMILFATVALIEFSYDAAEAAITPALGASRRTALALLAGALAVKLWIQLGRHLGEWATYISDRPVSVIRVLLTLAALVAIGLVARRVHRGVRDEREFERVKERVLFGGIFVVALPAFVIILAFQLAETVLVQSNLAAAYRLIVRFADSSEALFEYSRATLWGIVLISGLFLWTHRGARARQRELGLAMVVLGAWNVPAAILTLLDLRPGFGYAFFDLAVTVAVALFAIVTWRRLSSGTALALTALILFGWLAFTQGDFIGILGGFLGLSAVVILIFGILFTLLADSALASGDGRHLPRGARLLLWVGYLTLSVTIFNWIQVTHAFDFSGAFADIGFFNLGLPIAAWLVIRWWADPAAPRAGPGGALHERHREAP